MYYDKEGKEIDVHEFSRKFSDLSYQRIARTEIGPDCFVSTVWLGLDHAYGGNVPMIFETMSFENDEWVEARRYSTVEEALAGHEKIVAVVQARHTVEPEFGRKIDV